jgi:hypothetical protein
MLILMVVLGGCVADTEAPPPVEITTTHVSSAQGDKGDGDVDLCALAAELPDDDICSKICDPDAMAVQMVATGSAPGSCYQLYCSLPRDEHVLVGVCLPPP